MFLGIDVSKATLDAALVTSHDVPKARHKKFDNTPAGHQQLLSWLASHTQYLPEPSVVHATLEATGTYAEAIARVLHDSGIAVSLVNPAPIRAYAQSHLSRTKTDKTDKTDAILIARFCASHKPPLWTPPAPSLRQLQALLRRIEALEEMKQMEQNRLGSLPPDAGPAVRSSLQDHILYLETQIKDTQNQIQQHIQDHPDLRDQAKLLCSIPGIAHTTAALLLAELGEIGHFNSARQVAAFAGLVPRLKESGTSVRGKPCLSKLGSSRLRKALYFPAMTALRYNPFIIALGVRLAAAGKHKMVILGAAMRKLLHIAFGVLKSGKVFDPDFDSLTLKLAQSDLQAITVSPSG